MSYQTARIGRNRRELNDENRLKYAFDAGFSSGGGHPHDSPQTPDFDAGGSDDPPSSDPESSNGKSTSLTGLTASLRVLSDSLMRMERAEVEMAKTREALRLQSETRRLELEAEMTQMLLRTELQIASLVSRRNPSRKRKRVEEDQTTSQLSQREGSLLVSLIQCNLLF